MKITFHGAAQTVTGSQHLLEVNGSYACCWIAACTRAGGRRPTSATRTFRFDPANLDAVILSHAHIDHSGNLPNLVKSGYDGPIYTTPATAHLANIMLLDSGHIQEADAGYVNKKHVAARASRRSSRSTPWRMPPRWPNISKPVTYDQPFELVPGVTAHSGGCRAHPGLGGGGAGYRRDDTRPAQDPPVVLRRYRAAQPAAAPRSGAARTRPIT